MEENNKLSNLPSNDRIFGEANALPGQLISIISRNLLPKPGSFHYLDLLLPNSDSKTVCDYIYLLLSLNQLQHLTVKTILNHAIKNKENIFFYIDQQQFIYIKGEKRVRKSRVIKAIEMRFTILSKKKELVISAPTSLVANGVNRSTVYAALRVNNKAKKNYQVKDTV